MKSCLRPCAVLLLVVAVGCFEEAAEGPGMGTRGATAAGESADGATTAASDSGADASGTEASSSDGGVEPGNCEDYCDLIEACDGDTSQFSTSGPCRAVCEHMPLGTAADQIGNSVGCRVFHAIQAGEGTDAKPTFCQNAGPAGNGVCGGECESFCAIALSACTGDNQVFDSTIACTQECMRWPMEPAYNSMSPEADNYACRLKHLTYATLDPGTHCSHIGTMSDVCR